MLDQVRILLLCFAAGQQSTAGILWQCQLSSPIGVSSVQVLPVHREDIIHGNCKWLGYLSSTAVYGDWQGKEVNEEYGPRTTSHLSNGKLSQSAASRQYDRPAPLIPSCMQESSPGEVCKTASSNRS